MAAVTRALVFTRTTDYRHESIPDSVAALQAVPELDVVHSEDPADVARCEEFDVVVFLSTSGDVLDDASRTALRTYVEGGGGFAGIHCAAVTEASWDFYGDLLGARFAGHPEGCQPAQVVVVDGEHPSTQGLPAVWPFEDEWYSFGLLADGTHVLATVDEGTYDPGEFAMGAGHPQAWAREVGRGRSWFTALGHSSAAWADPVFLGHVVGGITSVARA